MRSRRFSLGRSSYRRDARQANALIASERQQTPKCRVGELQTLKEHDIGDSRILWETKGHEHAYSHELIDPDVTRGGWQSRPNAKPVISRNATARLMFMPSAYMPITAVMESQVQMTPVNAKNMPKRRAS